MLLKLLQLAVREDFKGGTDADAFRALVADAVPVNAPPVARRMLGEVETAYRLMGTAYAKGDIQVAEANKVVLGGLLKDLHEISHKLN